MKSILAIYIIIVVLATATSHANILVPGGPNSCALTLMEKQAIEDAKEPAPWIQYSNQVAGTVIGVANDVVVTATHGGLELLAPGISKWILFANETANVVSTSTGKSWIYSGVRKRLIDGVAMGAIIGQSVKAGVESGPYAAASTFAINVGLTFWFPNKYFHSIMVSLPKYMPKPIREALEHPVGQGFVGLSMIAVLEIVVEHTKELAHFLPGLFSYQTMPKMFFGPVIEDTFDREPDLFVLPSRQGMGLCSQCETA